MKKYVVIEKKVGETPLQAVEKYRAAHPELQKDVPAEDFWMQMPLLQGLRRKSRMWRYGDERDAPKERQMRQKYPLPMAYAGRLDPMASGKLLILIGDECKHQEKYHALDKEYEFSVLLGASSDTGDVLGLLEYEKAPDIAFGDVRRVANELGGRELTLPYPHFSSKTVKGKPLHVWTLEGRLDEIEVPTITSHIYKLSLKKLEQKKLSDIYKDVLKKIDTIPPVTEKSKALGKDFRRDDVRVSWKAFHEAHAKEVYPIATFTCIASSGTYMRSLAGLIGEKLGTKGLAYHIHRTHIGRYQSILGLPFWHIP